MIEWDKKNKILIDLDTGNCWIYTDYKIGTKVLWLYIDDKVAGNVYLDCIKK